MIRLKIIAVISLSLIIIIFLNKTVFLGNTPRISLRFLPRPTPTLTPTPYPTFTPLPSPYVTVKPAPTVPPKRYTILPTATPIPTVYVLTPFANPTATQIPTPTPQATSRLSQSKLGIFILSSYSNGAKNIVAAGPRVIKVMDPQNDSGLMNAVIQYKNKFPEGVVVLRIYIDTGRFDTSANPVTSAESIFNQYIKPGLNSLGANLKFFDYIETPNESEQTPPWDNVENIQWLAQFWERLADLDNQSGIKTCAGSIAVGNVAGSTFDEIGQNIGYFVPTLRYLKQIGGAWCYHGYTLNYTTDVNQELWYSLRYRVFYNYLQANAPDVADIPMIISEGGVDQSGDPKTSGWSARGSASKYENWLQWYDNQIKQDPYIIGVTLFQIGDGNWSSFNLEPISSWLTDYLRL